MSIFGSSPIYFSMMEILNHDAATQILRCHNDLNSMPAKFTGPNGIPCTSFLQHFNYLNLNFCWPKRISIGSWRNPLFLGDVRKATLKLFLPEMMMICDFYFIKSSFSLPIINKFMWDWLRIFSRRRGNDVLRPLRIAPRSFEGCITNAQANRHSV